MIKCPKCGKYQSSWIAPDEHTQEIVMHCDNCGNEWTVPNPKYVRKREDEA
jgi:transcription elongation factor Elf1